MHGITVLSGSQERQNEGNKEPNDERGEQCHLTLTGLQLRRALLREINHCTRTVHRVLFVDRLLVVSSSSR